MERQKLVEQKIKCRVVVVLVVVCFGCFSRRLITEQLSRHVDSIASCLRSAHCDSVVVFQLLSLLQLPNNADISCLTRLSHHVVFCFFTTMHQHGKLLCVQLTVYQNSVCLSRHTRSTSSPLCFLWSSELPLL